MSTRNIRIATRASQLALWQASHVADLLRQECGVDVELIEVRTEGDANRTSSLRDFGGLGVFTREVQIALLDGRADLAVHSLKDLPTEPTEGLILNGTTVRAPVFDVLALPAGAAPIESIRDLSAGTRVGTGSPRRQAQLRYRHSDLTVAEIRGNVETRIRKLDDGEYDAIVLAQAGLARLGFDDRISLVLTPPEMFPAVGQGALGLECRADDAQTQDALDQINHSETWLAVRAERAMLAELRAGCHAPVGVHTRLNGGEIELHAVLFSDDGVHRVECEAKGSFEEPAQVGVKAAQELRKRLTEARGE